LNAFLTQCHASVERRLTRRYIQSVCCLLLGFFLIVQTFSFLTNDKGRTAFGPYLGADFAVFYVAGSIFDAYPPERIYDINLHTQLYRGLFPGVPPDAQLPYANAPFFVLPFAVLAHLPYQWAYLIWMIDFHRTVRRWTLAAPGNVYLDTPRCLVDRNAPGVFIYPVSG
jgi:hypothetical protein